MTRNQQQEKNCKKHKHVETKQHAKHQWITEEIKEEIKKYLEANDNKDMSLQNLWDVAKAVLRGNFIARQAYLRKQEKAQINNQILHLKKLVREQTRPKGNRMKEIIKIRE